MLIISRYLLGVICLLIACTPVKKDAATTSSSCLPSQSSCIVTTAHGSFKILFNAEKITTEVPFNITVRYQGEYFIKALSGHLEGKDMYMGKVPVFFDADITDKNVFIAQSMLGSCSKEKMIWQLWLNVIGDKADASGPFAENFFIEFESTRF